MAPCVLFSKIHGCSEPYFHQIRNLKFHGATLSNFSRHQLPDVVYPGITPNPGKEVHGTLVTGLTNRDVLKLDVYESWDYDRVKVKVRVLDKEAKSSGDNSDSSDCEGSQLGNRENSEGDYGKDAQDNGTLVGGEMVECWVYLYNRPANILKGSEWDFREFCQVKMPGWFGPGVVMYSDQDVEDILYGRWKPREVYSKVKIPPQISDGNKEKGDKKVIIPANRNMGVLCGDSLKLRFVVVGVWVFAKS
ncbi:hypothetical protein BZA77DRAFT_324300 [Pyronema omphalodes]|nr:hypothetical protein BZA77DRAFT_324300 [Pyronema omphalodes]